VRVQIVVEVGAGPLAIARGEPLDLCGECTERFNDWLKTGQQAAHDGLGAAAAEPVMETVTRGG